MKYILFFYIFIISSITHTSHACINRCKTPKHLRSLYETYKELEHVYALNLFYSGTQYEYQPKNRREEIILKHLPRWNGFIRSQLTNKTYFSQENIEFIKTLQIHQKDAQILTILCKQYNQWRHNAKEQESFMQEVSKGRTFIEYFEAIERFFIMHSDNFNPILNAAALATSSSTTPSYQGIPKYHTEILNDHPELAIFEIEQDEETKRVAIEDTIQKFFNFLVRIKKINRCRKSMNY